MTITIQNDDSGLNVPAGSQTIPGPLTVSTGGITLSDPTIGVFKERGRSVAVGEWATFIPVITAATGSISGSGPQTARFSVIGKTLSVVLYAASVYTLSGGPASSLAFTIPGGFTCATHTSGVLSCAGGTSATGSWAALSGGTVITLYGAAFLGGSWANGVVAFLGTITLEIQ